MKKALITGTFDPFTEGHHDLVKRAAALFDEVHLVVFDNSEKNNMFNGDQRFEIAKRSLADVKNAVVGRTSGLVVGYAEEHGINVIIKGVRDTKDFEYEYDLSLINKEIGDIETLFLPTSPEKRFISSTFVREMIRHGVDISKYVPKGGYEYIASLIACDK